MTLRWVPGWNGLTEPEAVSYVAAVEAADEQELEFGVARAINDFVAGCKSDGIWDAIKASCILAGARTLDGALVPLVGGAPTNNFFVSGDYDRETGLVGDGSTKYLDSNRAGNADPQDSVHLSCWVSTVHDPATATPVNAGCVYVGCGSNLTGSTHLGRIGGLPAGANSVRCRSATVDAIGSTSPSIGLFGATRSSPASYTARTAGVNYLINRNSESSPSDNYFIHARNNGSDSAEVFCNGRLAFYSIGESLNLTALDTRVSNLITAIGAAIP